MARSLLKLSMELKNISRQAPRYFNTIKVHRNNVHELQVIPKKNQTEAEITRELADIIKSNTNPPILLSIIEKNKNIVTGGHIAIALMSMSKYCKENKIPPEKMHNNEHFIKLCSLLNKNLLKLNLLKTIQAIRVFHEMKVSSSAMIVQSLLQIVRNSVNDLELSEIFYLSGILTESKPTHLHEALLTALPLVFQEQCKIKLDKEDIVELKNSLMYACKYTNDLNLIYYLIDCINSYRYDFDCHTALTIVWALSYIKERENSDSFKNVLGKTIAVIKDNIDLLNLFEVFTTLNCIRKNEYGGIKGFYDFILVDKILQKAMDNNLGFEEIAQYLKQITNMRHINLKLLEYMSNLCCENPKILSECTEDALTTFVHGLSKANYKPKKWDELQKLIINNHTKLQTDAYKFYFFAVNLGSLDCFDSIIFSKAFNFLHNVEFNQNLTLLKRLYYCSKFFYPSYTGPWPSNETIESFKNVPIFSYRKPEEFKLLTALEYVFKDTHQVKTNLLTKEGFYIDHLIIPKDVALESVESKNVEISTDTMNLQQNDTEESNSIINVEDLNIPKEIDKVAVLFLPYEVCGRNIEKLSADILLNIKLLRATSYRVVYVSRYVWDRMPESEMIPYLKHLLAPHFKTIDDFSKDTMETRRKNLMEKLQN